LGIPLDAAAYICGPADFINDTTAALTGLGLHGRRIHSELFGALPPINPGVAEHETAAPHQPLGQVGTGPAVTFARSGITVRWRDSDTTLLELAEACDVPTRWACRSGVCHTCVTPVIDGRIEYRPEPLELPAPGQVLVCSAHPTEDLLLDA
jgi:ferredoxin